MATRRGTSPSDKQREQWAAERRAKLADLHERVVAEVGKITDSDQWRRWLQFAAKFHGYSFNNVLLIMAQRPDATWVAGYKRWKTEFGRHVRKGEKGIAILAPVTKRVTDDPQESPEDRSEPTKQDPQLSAAEQTAQPARVLHTFKPVAVFDISQTEGPDIDVPGGPAFADVMPQLLEGQAPAGLYDQLVMLAEERGYTVERGDCRGANGFTDYTNRLIKVRDDVDDAQAVKTMIHELGHVDLHTPSDFGWETTRGCRGEREVEAESVAFLVAERYGLDTSTYTFAYVALWAQRAAEQTGQSPEGIVQAAGQRIVSAAFRITEAVDINGTPDGATVAPALAAQVTSGVRRASAARATAEASASRATASIDQPLVAAARAFPPLFRTVHADDLAPTPAAANAVTARRGTRLP
ncbi:ArdC family protein [Micromonospora sp. NBC_01740]|uniref:ArdC family protein n=1 Tax=Micromonospora sp. NBC_01740 TaxID=2975986 RepID=UPI002E10588C|nr:ArdC family protein [Micromonospora sp. NBC_01740]